MKYLEILTRIRTLDQKAHEVKRELTNFCDTGDIHTNDVAAKKQAYMRLESERRVLKDQADEMIRTSSDIEVMRALYLRRVNRVPWEDIGRRMLSNRSEMDLRLGAYEYIKRNYDHPEAYSDCF